MAGLTTLDDRDDDFGCEAGERDQLAEPCPAAALFARYRRLGTRKLTGHSDIAPGRKTDPGPHFDWSRLHAMLAAT